MNPDGYIPKTIVLRNEYENYLAYLRSMGADEKKINEMTKDAAVIDFTVKNNA